MKMLESQIWTLKSEDGDITLDFENYKTMGTKLGISQNKNRIILDFESIKELMSILSKSSDILTEPYDQTQ